MEMTTIGMKEHGAFNMDCRRIKRVNGKNIVVWFGSYGLNKDETAKFYNVNDKHDNISKEQEAVADSLTQRLSVLEGELWYSITEGLPLLNKIKSKIELDATITEILFGHPDVVEITKLESQINDKKEYSASITVETTYGEVSLEV